MCVADNMLSHIFKVLHFHARNVFFISTSF